jgi:hypothetical protein
MISQDAISAFAALFIVGMLWLRTRIHYRDPAPGGRALTRAGAMYFVAFALVLLCGWFAAPSLARVFAGTTPVPATLARVVWFLLAYYLFIPLHRVLQARGHPVFSAAGAGTTRRR